MQKHKIKFEIFISCFTNKIKQILEYIVEGNKDVRTSQKKIQRFLVAQMGYNIGIFNPPDESLLSMSLGQC